MQCVDRIRHCDCASCLEKYDGITLLRHQHHCSVESSLDRHRDERDDDFYETSSDHDWKSKVNEVHLGIRHAERARRSTQPGRKKISKLASYGTSSGRVNDRARYIPQELLSQKALLHWRKKRLAKAMANWKQIFLDTEHTGPISFTNLVENEASTKAREKENRQELSKRRQFREHLYLVFRCFSVWLKEFRTSQKTREMRVLKASRVLESQKVRNTVQKWRYDCTFKRYLRRRDQMAIEGYRYILLRSTYSHWIRSFKMKKEVRRRQRVHQLFALQASFRQWTSALQKRKKIDQISTHFQKKHCRRCFMVWSQHIRQQQKYKHLKIKAQKNQFKRLLSASFQAWKTMLETSTWLTMLDQNTFQLGANKAIRKWKLFQAQKKIKMDKNVLASTFYEVHNLGKTFSMMKTFQMEARVYYLKANIAHFHRIKMLNRKVMAALLSYYSYRKYRQVLTIRATKYRCAQLGKKSLFTWCMTTTIKNHESRQIRSFHRAKLRKALLKWNGKAAKHRETRSICQYLLLKFQKKLRARYFQAWTCVRKQKARIQALEHQRHYRCTRECISAWYNFFRSQKLHKYLLSSHLCRKNERLRQKCFLSWKQHTSFKRCRKRMVRLFRKKWKRTQLRYVWWCLKAHTSQSRIEVKRRLRVQRRIFSIWNTYRLKQKTKQMHMIQSNQFYRLTGFAIAVTVWKSSVDTSISYKQDKQKAQTHYSLKLSTAILHEWYIITRHRQRQRDYIIERNLDRENNVLRYCLHELYIIALHRRYIKTMYRKALRLYERHTWTRHFAQWCRFLHHRHEKRMRVMTAVDFYRVGLKSTIFHHWQLVASTIREQNSTLCAAYNSLLRYKLEQTVAHWHRQMTRRRYIKQQRYKAECFYADYLYGTTFFTWEQTVQATRILKEKQRLVRCLHVHRNAQKGIYSWKAFSKLKYRSRYFYDRSDDFHRTSCLHRGVYAFDAQRQQSKQSKKRMKDALDHWQSRQMKRTFSALSAYSASIIKLKTHLRQIFQNDRESILTWALSAWRIYKSPETYLSLANSHYHRHLLHMTWSAWTSYRSLSYKMQKHKTVAFTWLCNNKVKRVFNLWKIVVNHRRKIKDIHEKLTLAILKFKLRRVISKWKALQQKAKDMNQASNFYRIQRTRCCFTAWKFYKINIQQEILLIKRAASFFWKAHANKHLCAWRNEALRQSQQETRMCEAFIKAHLEKRIWRFWLQYTNIQRSIQKLQDKIHLRFIEITFKGWAELSIRRIKLQDIEHAVYHRMKERLVVNTWKMWLKYISKQHAKQYHLTQAQQKLKYLKQRNVFEEWKLVVESRRDLIFQWEVAISFSHRLTQKRVLRALLMYVVRRHEVKLFLYEKGTSFRLYKCVHAIKTWRKHALASSSVKQLLLVANERFYTHHTKRAVANLRQYHTQKLHRQMAVAKASDHHARSVSRCSFRRWAAYHAWRAKTRNIVCLFQSAQAKDIFRAWKHYSGRAIRKRYAKALAEHHHRKQQLQITWLAFQNGIRLEVLEEKADKMHCSLSMRRYFCLWKRVIRILYNVRKLLGNYESMTVGSHFEAWKRIAKAKSRLNKQLALAVRAIHRIQLYQYIRTWVEWLEKRKAANEVIFLATHFRRRYIGWRILSAWKRHWECQKRYRLRKYQGEEFAKTKLVQRVWVAYKGCLHRKKCVHQKEVFTKAQLSYLKLLHCIHRWKDQRNDKRRRLERTDLAQRYRNKCMQRKYWNTFRQVVGYIRSDKHKFSIANCRLRVFQTRQAVKLLLDNATQSKLMRCKAKHFRKKYFQSVQEKCFREWKFLRCVRKRIRSLWLSRKMTVMRSIFVAWNHRVQRKRRNKSVLESFIKDKSISLLKASMHHWELVSTDLWLAQRLIEQHKQRAQERFILYHWSGWKQFLINCHKRRAFRARNRKRYRAEIRIIFQAFHAATASHGQKYIRLEV